MKVHAENETTILFLRRKDAPNKNFVTIELCNNRIKQVKASCNKIPDDDVLEFVLDYIDLTGLSLVEAPDWKGDEEGLDSDLLKYIERTGNIAA